MSRPIVFATSNEVKFTAAHYILRELAGPEIIQNNIELEEVQADSETIARHKAERAFKELQQAVLITDDEWVIPGLNGFPGAYMKYMNHWLTADDWLRLTGTLKDRTIILRQHLIYHDGTRQHYFTDDITGTLMREVKGDHRYPSLAIVSFDGGKTSRAETIAHGEPLLRLDMPSVWHKFADWYSQQ